MSPGARLIIALGKSISFVSQTLHLGAGATWPGEVALILRPNIALTLVKNLRKGVILVAGTNGKTTTSLMITKILESNGFSVVHNASGANLLNGIVSALIQQSHADWGVFEVDENSVPIVLKYVKPKIIILLNLFRDQLDRYGEVDVIVEKWQRALSKVEGVTYILNADDPAIAFLGRNKKSITYFGVNDKKHFLKGVEHATDSTFCLNCGARLTYEGIYYSHIGVWHCKKCGFSRPNPDVSIGLSPLPGFYNKYNALGALSVAKALGIAANLANFKAAFGRQEEFEIDGKKVKIFLSKNPAGFNASLRTALEMKAKTFLVLLNDRIPDGRDISWIWDVDFEMIDDKKTQIFIAGDRVYDLALRLKYAGLEAKISDVGKTLKTVKTGETLFVLPTYSAMLEIRRELLGRKIL